MHDMQRYVATEFIEEYEEQSGRGGSAFEQVDPRTPAGAALAIPTVLFRPFPFEAHNLNARIASLEGLALLALMVFRWRSVVAALAVPLAGYLRLRLALAPFLLAAATAVVLFFAVQVLVARHVTPAAPPGHQHEA